MNAKRKYLNFSQSWTTRVHAVEGQRLVRIALHSHLLINVIQQPGSSSRLFWLQRSSVGVIWMCRTSFNTDSFNKSTAVPHVPWAYTAPAEVCFNHDRGLELLGCWTTRILEVMLTSTPGPTALHPLWRMWCKLQAKTPSKVLIRDRD